MYTLALRHTRYTFPPKYFDYFSMYAADYVNIQVRNNNYYRHAKNTEYTAQKQNFIHVINDGASFCSSEIQLLIAQG